MTASWHLGPALHAQAALRPFARRQVDLFGEKGYASRNFNVLPWLKLRRRVGALVVGANRRRYGFGGPIEHYVGEQLIFAETPLDLAITIAPCAEFFKNPRGQANRRVIQAIGQRLRLGR